MKKYFRAVSVALTACMLCVLTGVITASFAGESIKLKDVNSTNYFKYVKPVKAAYGYNKGECKRRYLPHEEHFYSEYYDHWNVDVVYDYELINKLYTEFERTKPEISSVKRKGSSVLLKWKGVKGAEKYIIKVKRGRDCWRILTVVGNGKCKYSDRAKVKNGVKVSYRIYGVKHVRLWDVKTQKSNVQTLL